MGFFSKVWKAVTGTIKAIIKNPVTAIAAIGLAIYAPALGLRMLGSMMLSNVLNAVTAKDSNPDGSTTANAGNTQVIPAKTTNKIPAVYGKAFLSPILVDAKISTDNQTMWFVGALCEAPTVGTATVTFGKVLWDGQTVTFGSGGRVTKLTNAAGQEDTKIDGNLWIYFYNGSGTPLNGTTQTAYQVLQDSAIATAARWTGTEKMNNTVFVIMKLVYSSDDNVTGLPGNLQFETNIYQNGVTDGYKPGSAMMDYLTNTRFGAGLDGTQINTQSFLDLDTYSDQVITYTPVGGGAAVTQPRYRFNGMIDPTQSIMSNWSQMATCSDSFIQYNETLGKWSVITNKAYTQAPNIKTSGDLFLLSPDNIIGGINITPLDLNSTPNAVESTFFNYKTNGQSDSVYAETPKSLQNKYEPPQQLTMNYPFINDYVRAQYLSNRKLEQCRADYIVDLTCDYSAITIDAGDVVKLTYQPFSGTGFSWTNKPFRVTQIQESRGDDGSLVCKLQLLEYSSAVYDNWNIQDYTPPASNYVTDPTLLSKPDAPTIPGATVLPKADTPTFIVKAKIPTTGVTAGIEFWYGPTTTITDNNYKLYETQYNSSGSQYAQSTPSNPIYESVTVSGMPAGTMYWRVRVIGLMRKSEFSDPTELIWEPVSATNVGDTDGAADKPVMLPVAYVNWPAPTPPATVKTWPDNTRGVLPRAYVTATASPGSMRVYFSVSVHSTTNSQYNCVELWKSVASDVYNNKIYSIRHSYDVTAAQSETQYIQAVGLDIDYRSSDGGVTWDAYDTGSTPLSLTGQISYVQDSVSYPYQTHVIGSYQDADGTSTDLVNAGYRFNNLSTEPEPVHISFITTPGGLYGTKITGSLNEIAVAPGTGEGTAYQRASIIVGDNGAIYFYRNNTSVTAPPVAWDSSKWIKESPAGLLNHLYSVYANRTDGTGKYTAVVCGAYGTILKSLRTDNVTDTWTSIQVTRADGTNFTRHLYAVAGNDIQYFDGLGDWVAVGQNGAIIVSSDDGDTWQEVTVTLDDGTTLEENLRGVRWSGTNWMIVGENGTVLTSTNLYSWVKATMPSGFETRNLWSVDYSPAWDRFNIGGDGCVLTTNANIINIVAGLSIPKAETYAMTRIWNRGSFANVQTTGSNVSVDSQLVNGQTISSTVIDTNYKSGDELGYWLIVGSTKGDANHVVRVGGAVLTVTEYKK